MMHKRVLVPLANGFEEIEAISVIDVLRRAGIEVTTASVGETTVRGAHGVSLLADAKLDDCTTRDFDMIVLPGGMPGATHLAESALLTEMLRKHHGAGRPLAAICASPAVVLHPLDLLGRDKAACYPCFRDDLDAVNRTDEPLCASERLVTAAGPGVALAFALALVKTLAGKAKADELAESMIVP